ncbi:hypothetical protein IV203_026510 [Nitzschia inconspicua]|uniref:Uncharacterized protein n=1 Tax=Nitzschia inconspicua TaxID=303405 RepID=A0A9K3LK36_9STRA|nr:hypothetical protein IV203_026510 [Nitzschia inconspicua]
MLIPPAPISTFMAPPLAGSRIATLGSVPTTTSLWSSSLLLDTTSADWKSLAFTALIRGGELFARQQTEHIDINRVRMRLEGLQAYGTLCALLANGCLRLYSSVNESSNQNRTASSPRKARKQLALDVFFLSIVLSVLSGSYTTVVFTLLPLYSKMALGRGYDKQFLKFWASTAGIRENGFTAFLFSLVSFEVAFVLSLYLRLRGRRKRVIVLVATVICGVSFGSGPK